MGYSDSPIRYTSLASTITTGTVISSTSGTLMGCAIGVTATATVTIYDGTSSSGTKIISQTVNAGSILNPNIPEVGINLRTGLFVDVSTGTCIGTIWGIY